MSSPLASILAPRTAPSDSDRYTNDIEVEEAIYYLELFGMVLGTIAIMAIVFRIIPLLTNGLYALSHKIRERKERRRAAEDEEKAIELVARCAADAASGQKALVGAAGEPRLG